MSKKRNDYTARALEFTARFPILNYLSIQINFWVIANILLGVIMHLHALAITETLQLPQMSSLVPAIIIFVLLDFIFATPGLHDNFRLSTKTWQYFFDILLIYYFFMTLVINFINQV